MLHVTVCIAIFSEVDTTYQLVSMEIGDFNFIFPILINFSKLENVTTTMIAQNMTVAKIRPQLSQKI
jgi:hypothetical protein